MNDIHMQNSMRASSSRRILNAAVGACALALLGACSTAGSSSTAGPADGLGEPFRFVCNDTPPSTVVARYRQPGAASMMLRRGDAVAELQRQPAASGARYAGADVEFWEHQGEVRLRWGKNAAPVLCKRQG